MHYHCILYLSLKSLKSTSYPFHQTQIAYYICPYLEVLYTGSYAQRPDEGSAEQLSPQVFGALHHLPSSALSEER